MTEQSSPSAPGSPAPGHQPRFAGIVPPILTPLEDDHSLDEQGLERLIDHVVTGGVHGLFVLGSTGEGPSLPLGMKLEMIRCVRQMAGGRVRLIVNITATCLDDSKKMAKTAAQNGCDAVAAAPPFYFPLSQADLTAYYRDLAARSPLPLMLYNIPSHTKTPISHDALRALTQVQKIVGLKDSSFDMSTIGQTASLLRDRPDWTLLVGGERFMAQTMRARWHGCVGGSANIWPKLVVQLYEALRRGDEAKINEFDARVQQMTEIYTAAGSENGSILALKQEAARRKLCSARVAAPLRQLDPSRAAAVERKIAELNLA